MAADSLFNPFSSNNNNNSKEGGGGALGKRISGGGGGGASYQAINSLYSEIMRESGRSIFG